MSVPVDENLNQWFIREILVHERALVRFLARVWPDRAEINDLCHDIYIRVYESVARRLPASPRGFLFATARHLLIDRVRRGKIVSIEVRGDLDSLNVLIDELSPEERASAREDLWRLAQAFGSLPEICREVMWLVKVEELTQRQIAQRLGISAKAVERRIARGVRLLEDAYFSGKEPSVERPAKPHEESESGHG